MTWAGYDGPLRRLIVAHKDQDRADLAAVLAVMLGEVVDQVTVGLARPLLVPAPSSPASRRLRGREPLSEIARRMQLSAPLPLAPVLRLRRRVRDQAGLAHEERQVNLLGSMVVADGCAELLDGADVVLLDDVVTTGATLSEATRALLERQGGSAPVSTVSAAVICATERTHTVKADPGLSPRCEVD